MIKKRFKTYVKKNNLLCNSKFADPYVLFFDPKYLQKNELYNFQLEAKEGLLISFKIKIIIYSIILNTKNRKSCITIVKIAKNYSRNRSSLNKILSFYLYSYSKNYTLTDFLFI